MEQIPCLPHLLRTALSLSFADIAADAGRLCWSGAPFKGMSFGLQLLNRQTMFIVRLILRLILLFFLFVAALAAWNAHDQHELAVSTIICLVLAASIYGLRYLRGMAQSEHESDAESSVNTINRQKSLSGNVQPLAIDQQGLPAPKLRPYQLVLIIWIILAPCCYFAILQDVQQAGERVQTARRVTGDVIRKGHYRKGSYSADLKIPPTFGIDKCDIVISKSEYERLRDRVEVIVEPLANNICRSVDSEISFAHTGTAQIVAVSAFFDSILSAMLYVLISGIGYGSPRRSLRQRWKAEELSN